MIIESTKNPAAKRAKSLANRKDRVETGLHFIEGDKLVREAVISGVEFRNAFVEEGHDLMNAILEGSGAQVYTVTRSVMKSITNTNEPQWVCAEIVTPTNETPRYYPDGLIVVMDNVQDPGNIGTVIRTADAFGAAGVILGEGCADPFGPKTIRASMGSVYHLPVWCANGYDEVTKLKEQGYTLVCGDLSGSEDLPTIAGNTAVIIGNEGSGVSEQISALCEKYRLPMYGLAESLNASVAAGILIFEISRLMHT